MMVSLLPRKLEVYDHLIKIIQLTPASKEHKAIPRLLTLNIKVLTRKEMFFVLFTLLFIMRQIFLCNPDWP